MYRTPEGCAIHRTGEFEMDTPIKAKPAADLRDYLAEERTFLAWIRTGISLMGFGFVVARFGIFGDVLHAARCCSAPRTLGLVWGRAHCDRRDREPVFPHDALCVWSAN